MQMQIQNLEINILYFMCNPLRGQHADGTVMSRDVFDEFSDIPQGALLSAVNTMVDDGLISSDPSRSHLSITENGINRLQSSIACRIHRFDHCFCGRSG